MRVAFTQATLDRLEVSAGTIAHSPESPLTLLPKLGKESASGVESMGREEFYHYS